MVKERIERRNELGAATGIGMGEFDVGIDAGLGAGLGEDLDIEGLIGALSDEHAARTSSARLGARRQAYAAGLAPCSSLCEEPFG